MAKKKGGVGRHVTKNVPRTFSPNLHERRIWVPELKKFVRIRVTALCEDRAPTGPPSLPAGLSNKLILFGKW